MNDFVDWIRLKIIWKHHTIDPLPYFPVCTQNQNQPKVSGWFRVDFYQPTRNLPGPTREPLLVPPWSLVGFPGWFWFCVCLAQTRVSEWNSKIVKSLLKVSPKQRFLLIVILNFVYPTLLSFKSKQLFNFLTHIMWIFE